MIFPQTQPAQATSDVTCSILVLVASAVSYPPRVIMKGPNKQIQKWSHANFNAISENFNRRISLASLRLFL
jgi:hypothetical protein